MKATNVEVSIRSSVTVVSLVILGVFLFQSLGMNGNARAQRAPRSAKDEEAAFANTYCKTNLKTTVPSGSEAEARRYYKDLFTKIGFKVQDPPAGASGPTTTLVDVATYLGYGPRPPGTLTANDLQDALPAELMDPVALGKRLGGVSLSVGDVLVARFFAPKISDVSQAAMSQAGWRKLVRLRARTGSSAAAHGIDYGLFEIQKSSWNHFVSNRESRLPPEILRWAFRTSPCALGFSLSRWRFHGRRISAIASGSL